MTVRRRQHCKFRHVTVDNRMKVTGAENGPSTEWQVLARKGPKPRVGFQAAYAGHSVTAADGMRTLLVSPAARQDDAENGAQ